MNCKINQIKQYRNICEEIFGHHIPGSWSRDLQKGVQLSIAYTGFFPNVTIASSIQPKILLKEVAQHDKFFATHLEPHRSENAWCTKTQWSGWISERSILNQLSYLRFSFSFWSTFHRKKKKKKKDHARYFFNVSSCSVTFFARSNRFLVYESTQTVPYSSHELRQISSCSTLQIVHSGT